MVKPCSKIKIGELRHRITIEVNTRTPDGQGGYTQSWATHATVWAKIKQLSQSERMIAQKMDNPATHRFTCRYVAGVKGDMRITYQSREFNIARINNLDENNAFLEIDAVEGAPT